MPSRHATLEQRVRAAQRGDRDAFAQLVADHQSIVRATALAVTRALDASDDVAQRAFVTAWQKLADLREPGRFSPWIRQITQNLGLKHLRGEGRRHARVEPDSTTVDAATSPHIDAEARLLALEEGALVRAALADIPEPDRLLLVLQLRDDPTTRELAEHLGISDAAVRQRVVRARARLTEAVQHRLTHALRRGVPAVAFVAAVMGALPVRAAGGWRLVGIGMGAVLVLLLGLAGGWIGATQDPPSATVALRPAHTQRARALLRTETEVTPVPPVTQPTDYPYQLTLMLWKLDFISLNLGRDGRVDASRFFPTPDEAPLPDGPTSEFLQMVLDQEAVGLTPEGWNDSLLDLATHDGLLPLGDGPVELDPWAALVALEVEQRALLVRQKAARDKHYEGFSLSLPTEEIRRVNATRPKIEYAAFVSTVEALIDEWDGHPVADFYRLYLLDPWFEGESDVYDPARGMAVMADIVGGTDDALVTQAAVHKMADALYVAPTSREDRDVLETAVDELPPQLARGLLGALTRSAVGAEDWEAAARLNARYKSRLELECPGWPAVSVPSGEIPPDLVDPTACAFRVLDVERVDGRLAAMGAGPVPTTWRGSFVAAAWRCHLAHPGAGSLYAPGASDLGQWRWGPWEGDGGAFLACLDDARPTLLPPPPGLVVDIRLERRLP